MSSTVEISEPLPSNSVEPGQTLAHIEHVGGRLGVQHAQRFEDALAQELGEAQAADPARRCAPASGSRVAVDHAGAGLVVELALPRHHRQADARRLRVQAVGPGPEFLMPAPAAGVLHQLSQGRPGGAELGQLGQVAARHVVDVQLAVLGQQQDGQRGEVLAGRGQPHARARRVITPSSRLARPKPRRYSSSPLRLMPITMPGSSARSSGSSAASMVLTSSALAAEAVAEEAEVEVFIAVMRWR
ncbi:hypothetical protein Ddc_20449 [Ditylenchus destructor]|nr:hypothetical protein Ddc_20449 [Ditylenchus destructor]